MAMFMDVYSNSTAFGTWKSSPIIKKLIRSGDAPFNLLIISRKWVILLKPGQNTDSEIELIVLFLLHFVAISGPILFNSVEEMQKAT